MTGKKWMLGVLFLLFHPGPGETAPDLWLSTREIAGSDIALSKSLPNEGDRITIRAKIHNQGTEPVSGSDVLFTQVDSQNRSTPIGARLTEAVSPDSFVIITQEWTAPANGFYKILVVVDPEGKIPEKDKSNNAASYSAAVLARDLYFHFYSQPKSNRYVHSIFEDGSRNVERDYWLFRGVIPCQSKTGVGTDTGTEEEFIAAWSSAKAQGWPAISIDEFGTSKGGIENRLAPALIKTKQKCPDLFIIIWDAWGITSKTLTESYRIAADLVVNEQYRGYFGEYKCFDEAWRIIKSEGIADKTVFGLGVSSGRESWITTEQELLRQIRYIKRLAPEMPGVSFFGVPRPHLAKSIDKAIEDYYIKPVLYLKGFSSSKAVITNVGGMDARGVTVRFLSEKGGEELGKKSLDCLKVGEIKELKVPDLTEYVEFVPGEGFTILD